MSVILKAVFCSPKSAVSVLQSPGVMALMCFRGEISKSGENSLPAIICRMVIGRLRKWRGRLLPGWQRTGNSLLILNPTSFIWRHFAVTQQHLRYGEFELEFTYNPPFALSALKTIPIHTGSNPIEYHGTAPAPAKLTLTNVGNTTISNIQIIIRRRKG